MSPVFISGEQLAVSIRMSTIVFVILLTLHWGIKKITPSLEIICDYFYKPLIVPTGIDDDTEY